MDAFDADVLIYAALGVRSLGPPVAALFATAPDAAGTARVGIGSTLLVPELLTKPLRDRAEAEVTALAWYLARLDLLPVDLAIGDLAAVLGARYRLRATDAVHLATAVRGGADRFVTNNRRDSPGGSSSWRSFTHPTSVETCVGRAGPRRAGAAT